MGFIISLLFLMLSELFGLIYFIIDALANPELKKKTNMVLILFLGLPCLLLTLIIICFGCNHFCFSRLKYKKIILIAFIQFIVEFSLNI